MLQENKLAAISILAKRYAELDPKKPFVSSIEIKPVGKPRQRAGLQAIEAWLHNHFLLLA